MTYPAPCCLKQYVWGNSHNGVGVNLGAPILGNADLHHRETSPGGTAGVSERGICQASFAASQQPSGAAHGRGAILAQSISDLIMFLDARSEEREHPCAQTAHEFQRSGLCCHLVHGSPPMFNSSSARLGADRATEATGRNRASKGSTHQLRCAGTTGRPADPRLRLVFHTQRPALKVF